jgi:hypothetical protein
LVIATGAVVGVLVASLLAFGVLSTRPDATLGCVSQTSHLMDGVAALDGFSVNVDSDLPVIGRGSAPGESPPTFVTDYETGHITGYLSDIAVYGPYRTQLDAAASSLGYSIGKWPLVPLVGQVVKDNPGLLEVYVEVRAFKSDAGANSWLSSLGGSYSLADYKVVPPPNQHVALAVEGTLGQDDGLHEHIVMYDIQVASRVLRLAYQGGTGLSEALVAPETDAAIDQFVQWCGPVKE